MCAGHCMNTAQWMLSFPTSTAQMPRAPAPAVPPRAPPGSSRDEETRRHPCRAEALDAGRRRRWVCGWTMRVGHKHNSGPGTAPRHAISPGAGFEHEPGAMECTSAATHSWIFWRGWSRWPSWAHTAATPLQCRLGNAPGLPSSPFPQPTPWDGASQHQHPSQALAVSACPPARPAVRSPVQRPADLVRVATGYNECQAAWWADDALRHLSRGGAAPAARSQHLAIPALRCATAWCAALPGLGMTGIGTSR